MYGDPNIRQKKEIEALQRMASKLEERQQRAAEWEGMGAKKD